MYNVPTDEELRKLLKPDPTQDDVIRAIEASYGLTNVQIVNELESYDDRNYLIRHDETLFLVKIHNGVESAQYLRSNLKEMVTNTDDLILYLDSVRFFTIERCKSIQETPASCSYLGSDHYTNVFLSRPKSDPGVSSIDLQHSILQKLTESRYNITSSVPVQAIADHLDENLFITIHPFQVVSPVYSPCRLAMRLLHWVAGKPMSSCSSISIETIAQAGSCLGNLCHAMDDLTRENKLAVQAATRYHAWDGQNTLDLEKFAPYIKDPQRRSLVLSVLEAFREEFGEGVQTFRHGILHGDFNDANIIVNDLGRVDGVIDFGDSIFSWRVLDVTIAMAYAMLSTYGKEGHSLSAAAAMLRGFHYVYPLQENEIMHLRLFVASRLCCSVSIGAYSYQQNPENKYLLFHSEPAWRALELIWTGGKNGSMAKIMDELFQKACKDIRTPIGEHSVYCSDLSFQDPPIPDVMKI